MKMVGRLGLACCAVLGACQTGRNPRMIVVDGDRAPVAVSPSSAVQSTLAEAGVLLGPADRVVLNGQPVKLIDPIGPGEVGTLQVRHAVQVIINGQPTQSAAATVGQAVSEAGHDLYAADLLDPPADAPISEGMDISYTPSAPLTLTADATEIQLRSAAASIGDALAGAGIPLIGLDISLPASDGPLPEDGAIRLTRISETLVLAEEAIPFSSVYQDSPQVGLGQEQISQPGVNGMAVTRTRVRYEDGHEVSRQSEAEAVIRPAQDRIVARGTKIVEESVDLSGASIQYWLKTQMWATIYSPPCEAGKCSYSTASGLRAGKGVVAVDPSLYAYLNGQRLYIPGYGFAVIGDLGGGYLVEQSMGISRYKWIDLGFDANNMEDLTGWITVYFLDPPPATIPDALK